jgi:hypothetical protein
VTDFYLTFEAEACQNNILDFSLYLKENKNPSLLQTLLMLLME